MFPSKTAILSGGGSLVNNYSLSFDGTDDYVELDSEVNAGESSTISFWYYHGTNPSNDLRYMIGSDDGQHLGIRHNGASFNVHLGNYGHNESYTYALTDDTWYHFVFVRQDDDVDIYVDGTTGVTLNDARWIGDDTKVKFIGKRADGYYTKGNIDEVSIFNRVLTSGEVSAIYNNGTPTDLSSMSGLIGYWRFEEGTGTSVADSSTNTNAGTLESGVAFSSTVPS